MRIIGSVHRFLEIIFVLFYQFFRYLLLATANLVLRSKHAIRSKVITVTFEQLGGSFVKIAQIMSTRPDIFPKNLIHDLSRLQNEVQPEPAKSIRRIIENNTKLSGVLKSFDEKPEACGSIAQVHRALLNNGNIVALKVKRPNIDRKVKTDFRILLTIVIGIGWLPGLRILPLKNLVLEFKKTIEGQLDFNQEIESIHRMRKIFSDNIKIIIPKTYSSYCSQNVIVMDYYPNLKKLNRLNLTQTEKQIAAKTGLNAIYTMMFKEGFIHGDLHPGNLFFLPEGKLLLLDFGLISELKGKELEDYIEFFFSMATDNGKECARIVYETALLCLPAFNYENFEKDMAQMIHEFYKMNVEDFEVSSFATRLFNLERRHGIKGSTHFISFILALVVYEGMIKQLFPSLDFQEEARQVLIEIFEKRKI